MNPNHLNLYVVDDDKDTRKSLLALFGSSDKLSNFSIRAFDSGEGFLSGAAIDASGVVVLDLRMDPGMSGLQVHKELQQRRSPLVVVFLSGHGDVPQAVKAMKDGAFFWLSKPSPNDETLAVLANAAQEAKDIASERRFRFDGRQKWETLTLREKQVSALMAVGKSSREISDTLTRANPVREIEYRTVEGYRARVAAKLEVRNSNELLLFLQRMDLMDAAQASLTQTEAKKKS